MGNVFLRTDPEKSLRLYGASTLRNKVGCLPRKQAKRVLWGDGFFEKVIPRLLSRMIEKISVPVSVSLSFDHIKRKVFPKWVIWNGRLYPIIKVGLHHTYRQGRTLFHVFSVISKNLFFRLIFNTDNLHWRLEEISDGLPA